MRGVEWANTTQFTVHADHLKSLLKPSKYSTLNLFYIFYLCENNREIYSNHLKPGGGGHKGGRLPCQRLLHVRPKYPSSATLVLPYDCTANKYPTASCPPGALSKRHNSPMSRLVCLCYRTAD